MTVSDGLMESEITEALCSQISVVARWTRLAFSVPNESRKIVKKLICMLLNTHIRGPFLEMHSRMLAAARFTAMYDHDLFHNCVTLTFDVLTSFP